MNVLKQLLTKVIIKKYVIANFLFIKSLSISASYLGHLIKSEQKGSTSNIYKGF
jgi:hypothetical protein